MNRVETKTLAEIYLQQGHLKEAYEMFKRLSEKDPTDPEIQTRLYELGERFTSPSPPAGPSCLSTEERISILEGWLANIRKRRGA